MYNPSKSSISDAVKDIFLKCVIPQVLATCIYVLLHWAAVTYWLSSRYQTYDSFKLMIIGLLGGSAPFLSYGIWAFRKLLISSFSVFYDHFIHHWLKEFCTEIADKITNKTDHNRSIADETELKDHNVDQLHIIQSLRNWIIEKSQDLPIILKKMTHFLAKKIDSTFEIEDKLKRLNSTDPEEISAFLKVELSQILTKTSRNIIPFQVIYLIPINIALLILLWYY